MSETKQLMGSTFTVYIFSIIWKSLGPINFPVTNIFQNIFFYVQQKREIHTGLEQLEDDDDSILIFG